MGSLQNLTLSGLLVSFFIAGLLIFVNDLNTNYGDLGSVDNSSLKSLNKLQEFNQASDSAKDQATQESTVTTSESEESFLTNAFTFGKFIFTGGSAVVSAPILLVTDLVNSLTGFNIPPVFTLFVTSLVLFLASFGVIRGITGR